MLGWSAVRRTISRALFATLLAACGDEQVCHLDTCGDQVCTNFLTDPMNCGGCEIQCPGTQTCTTGKCVDSNPPMTCDAPMTACGSDCVDTQTSDANCGACGSACSADADCVTGACAAPLVAMTTVAIDSETGDPTARDLFVLQDRTFALTQLDTSTFTSDRVIDQAVLPDGRVVYVASQDTEGVFELYVVSPRGGTPVKLNPPLVATGNVTDGLVVHGTTVLYRADQDVAGEIDLYAVDVDAPATATKVNGALAAGGRVSRVVAISSDGKRVAYIADQDTPGNDEAYAVDMATPGTSVKLNPATVVDAFDLQMSADGSKVVLRAQDSTTHRLSLYLLDPASPGTATPIANTSEPTYIPQDVYRITGTTLVYTGGAKPQRVLAVDGRPDRRDAGLGQAVRRHQRRQRPPADHAVGRRRARVLPRGGRVPGDAADGPDDRGPDDAHADQPGHQPAVRGVRLRAVARREARRVPHRRRSRGR